MFFGDLFSAVLTIVSLGVIVSLLPVVNWAFLDAIWVTDNPDACRMGGACWAFIHAKLRLIIFGLYPPEEQWRPMLVIAIIIAMALISLPPRMWSQGLLVAWGVAVALMLGLMWGGFAGLTFVSTNNWGGLPVTLLLALLSLGLGFPFAVVLALGRRSDQAVPRGLCILVIETVRGLPLVGLLFVSAIILPLMLPADWSVDKLGRTLAALTIFSAAYLAEVIRGGLQGVASGQAEAAAALGIPRFKAIWHIVLPQAIQKVVPPLTNTAIIMVKNTSLVLIVGVFDMLSAGRSAATDPDWPAPYTEAYIFVAVIYFAICFSISLYSGWLERRIHQREFH
jgi:general L-amino acid transport system permease protein